MVCILFRRIGRHSVPYLYLPDKRNNDFCRVIPLFPVNIEDFRLAQFYQLTDLLVPDRLPFFVRLRKDQVYLGVKQNYFRF